MRKTIDIMLVGNDTNVEVNSEVSTSRTIIVSLSMQGLDVESYGTNRSITLDFDTLPSIVTWNNIIGKPNGKLFGGVITPSSAIPTTSADVYYIAFEPGLYAAFGFTLESGKMAIVYRQGNVWVRNMETHDNVGFVEGTRENARYFDEYEMAELRKDIAFYLGQGALFVKMPSWSGNPNNLLFAAVPQVIPNQGDNIVAMLQGTMEVFKNEDDDYEHVFTGDAYEFYTRQGIEENTAPITQAVPTGGTTGQVLAKQSDDDNDVEWVDQEAQADIDNITIHDIDIICI